MITKAFAKSQIARIAGLNFFPAITEARDELVFALQVARSEAIAASVIDGILSNPEIDACPIPAAIRRMCYERNELEQDRREAPRYCSACDQGWLLSYWLVTTTRLDGGSVHTARERLPFTDFASEYHYKKQLAAAPKSPNIRQEVFSAAARCNCRKEAA